jgi:hypothetical protein
MREHSVPVKPCIVVSLLKSLKSYIKIENIMVRFLSQNVIKHIKFAKITTAREIFNIKCELVGVRPPFLPNRSWAPTGGPNSPRSLPCSSTFRNRSRFSPDPLYPSVLWQRPKLGLARNCHPSTAITSLLASTWHLFLLSAPICLSAVVEYQLPRNPDLGNCPIQQRLLDLSVLKSIQSELWMGVRGEDLDVGDEING